MILFLILVKRKEHQDEVCGADGFTAEFFSSNLIQPARSEPGTTTATATVTLTSPDIGLEWLHVANPVLFLKKNDFFTFI